MLFHCLSVSAKRSVTENTASDLRNAVESIHFNAFDGGLEAISRCQ